MGWYVHVLLLCRGIDFEPTPTTSRDKSTNVAVLHDLVSQLDGHVLPTHKAIEILSAVRGRSVNPVSKMR